MDNILALDDEEDNEIETPYHFFNQPSHLLSKCQCCAINKEREKAWIESTTFQERYDALNNTSRTLKLQPIRISCPLCHNLPPVSA
jgi:hypothetical protein